MKTVVLSDGRDALVDDEDFASVAAHRWAPLETRTKTYARSGAGGSVLMHRLVMGLGPGDPLQVDHHNGNGLDNRRSNLRLADHSLNQANARRRRQAKPKTSRFKGVHWCSRGRRWIAKIQDDGQTFYLGTFADEEEAAHAYNAAAEARWGDFAQPNQVRAS